MFKEHITTSKNEKGAYRKCLYLGSYFSVGLVKKENLICIFNKGVVVDQKTSKYDLNYSVPIVYYPL